MPLQEYYKCFVLCLHCAFVYGVCLCRYLLWGFSRVSLRLSLSRLFPCTWSTVLLFCRLFFFVSFFFLSGWSLLSTCIPGAHSVLVSLIPFSFLLSMCYRLTMFASMHLTRTRECDIVLKYHPFFFLTFSSHRDHTISRTQIVHVLYCTICDPPLQFRITTEAQTTAKHESLAVYNALNVTRWKKALVCTYIFGRKPVAKCSVQFTIKVPVASSVSPRLHLHGGHVQEWALFQYGGHPSTRVYFLGWCYGWLSFVLG